MARHACVYWREQAKAGKPVTGRILNTTSGAGLFGNIGQANYAPAKSAIATLTVCTAMEMARYGVTANCLSPIAATRMLATIGRMLIAPKLIDPKMNGMRIGVHYGPAYRTIDHITGRTTFYGTEVSKAARIEPVTPPGAVFAVTGTPAVRP